MCLQSPGKMYLSSLGLFFAFYEKWSKHELTFAIFLQVVVLCSLTQLFEKLDVITL